MRWELDAQHVWQIMFPHFLNTDPHTIHPTPAYLLRNVESVTTSLWISYNINTKISVLIVIYQKVVECNMKCFEKDMLNLKINENKYNTNCRKLLFTKTRTDQPPASREPLTSSVTTGNCDWNPDLALKRMRSNLNRILDIRIEKSVA